MGYPGKCLDMTSYCYLSALEISPTSSDGAMPTDWSNYDPLVQPAQFPVLRTKQQLPDVSNQDGCRRHNVYIRKWNTRLSVKIDPTATQSSRPATWFYGFDYQEYPVCIDSSLYQSIKLLCSGISYQTPTRETSQWIQGSHQSVSESATKVIRFLLDWHRLQNPRDLQPVIVFRLV